MSSARLGIRFFLGGPELVSGPGSVLVAGPKERNAVLPAPGGHPSVFAAPAASETQRWTPHPLRPTPRFRQPSPLDSLYCASRRLTRASDAARSCADRGEARHSELRRPRRWHPLLRDCHLRRAGVRQAAARASPSAVGAVDGRSPPQPPGRTYLPLAGPRRGAPKHRRSPWGCQRPRPSRPCLSLRAESDQSASGHLQQEVKLTKFAEKVSVHGPVPASPAIAAIDSVLQKENS